MNADFLKFGKFKEHFLFLFSSLWREVVIRGGLVNAASEQKTAED